MLQFGSRDEKDFRAELSSGGLTRIEAALMKVDATYAKASVATDREYILNVVQREMGIDQFNEYIRDGIRREYKNISKLAAFGGSPLLWGRDL